MSPRRSGGCCWRDDERPNAREMRGARIRRLEAPGALQRLVAATATNQRIDCEPLSFLREGGARKALQVLLGERERPRRRGRERCPRLLERPRARPRGSSAAACPVTSACPPGPPPSPSCSAPARSGFAGMQRTGARGGCGSESTVTTGITGGDSSRSSVVTVGDAAVGAGTASMGTGEEAGGVRSLR